MQFSDFEQDIRDDSAGTPASAMLRSSALLAAMLAMVGSRADFVAARRAAGTKSAARTGARREP
jgi:hypothetical protein